MLRDEATLLAEIDGDPLIAVREVGAGRTAVFTSGMSAHWAPAGRTADLDVEAPRAAEPATPGTAMR
ncbi:hypothetical protein AA958_27320 [Streptomyces sp. CNQ-509]|uniref:glutamine amidotransferase n=1 Tax=Streptomyces sp. CNQ-509 TaxID=444103 RepID=UPI00062DF918|nr:glutamine amidotransferase [Streptomyces sp. CNQ-509]AKH85326.1 hypothetical protein AA958_27320 [Streptomyces sp. CNQ-509]